MTQDSIHSSADAAHHESDHPAEESQDHAIEPRIVEGEPLEGGIVANNIDDDDFLSKIGERFEKMEKGLNMIQNFIIKRAYPGDFISHDKEDATEDRRVVNITNAGADRIANDVGITESNRTTPVKFWHQEKSGHYYYRCEGDFSWRPFKDMPEKKIHAYGLASTMNPFYSKSHEKEVPIDLIREDFIQRECIRDLRKQAVRELLGLRRIPVSKLRELGFDISKVRYVSFKSKEGSQARNNPGATADKSAVETAQASFVIKVLSPRTWNDTAIIDLITEKNEKFSWWGKALDSDEGKKLSEFRKAGYLVTVRYILKGNYRNIEAIVDGVPQ